MPKPTPLVCQHLENISRDALEKYQDILRDYVRNRHGVYALYRRGKLYYIGLATNLRTRLKNHLKDKHQHSWDRFSVYLTLRDNHLRELESLLVRIVKPQGNKQKGKFANSEDMRKALKRALDDSHDRETKYILGVAPKPKSHSKPTADDVALGLAAYLKHSTRLRGWAKGQLRKAHVLKSGAISFARKHYDSPSAAARAAKGCGCNGWNFWHYQRAPGLWVSISELRK